MRAITALLFFSYSYFLAHVAWADRHVTANDRSNAVSRTMIGRKVEIFYISKEEIARVIDEPVRQGLVRQSENVAPERVCMVSPAPALQRVDFHRAVAGISRAVDVAVQVVAEGSSSSPDQLLDEVLKRIAERTKANDLAGATREAEEGFERWKKEGAARQPGGLATGIALLEAAVKTDLLRTDATEAAARMEQIASLQYEDDPESFVELLHSWADQFYVEGRDKGANFSLEVAIAIVRRQVAAAHGPDERGMALNELGTTLETLGERESGTAKLEEAIAAYQEALKQTTRERVPLDWAGTQMNLGNALAALGGRESGPEKLEDAVAAYREALKERTQERAPLDWAMTQMNLGLALWTLGERESGTRKLEEAVAAYREALKEWTRERVPLYWATTQANLGLALWTLGERESGTEKLEEAITAYREALKETTRERAPLDWARTQMNLGLALWALGQRESGTEKLEEAISAYREALTETTRERAPLDWATAQNNLGDALLTLGERQSGTGEFEEAIGTYREVVEELAQAAAASRQYQIAQQNLTRANGLLAERQRQ